MARHLLLEAQEVRQRIDGERLSPGEAVALRRNVEQRLAPSESRRRGLVWGAAAGAATAIALLAVWWLSMPAAEPTTWYQVQSGAACTSGDQRLASVSAGCPEPVVLAVSDAQVTLKPATRLAKAKDGVRLEQGWASFLVRPKVAGAEFRVHVSHGSILSVSTLFQVAQQRDRGTVKLVDGEIVFEWADGSGRQVLRPGETLRWPRPEAAMEPASPPPLSVKPESTPHPKRPARKLEPKPMLAPDETGPSSKSPPPDAEGTPPPSETDVVAIMRRLSQLRSQQRHDEAVAMLRRASEAEDLTDVQRERLSFEVGVLLADSLGNTAAACQHWRAHLRRFPFGHRSYEARQRLKQCSP